MRIVWNPSWNKTYDSWFTGYISCSCNKYVQASNVVLRHQNKITQKLYYHEKNIFCNRPYFHRINSTSYSSKSSKHFSERATTNFFHQSQPNAKQSVAKVLSSMFGLNFGATMKQLNQGGVVVLPLKKGETKEEAATIKSALEAAGAEVEVK